MALHPCTGVIVPPAVTGVKQEADVLTGLPCMMSLPGWAVMSPPSNRSTFVRG